MSRLFFLHGVLVVGVLALPLVACVSTDPISSGGGGGNEPIGHAGESAFGGYFPESGGAPPDTTTGAAVCDDGFCDVDEDCSTCPEDCECEGPVCGDKDCTAPDETCETCPEDCGQCAMIVCGDGTCSEPQEDCDNCYEDCGVCACKPDGKEPNEKSLNSTPLALATDLCKLSICSGDVDWFKFTTTKASFTVTVDFNQAEGDLDVEVYDPNYVGGGYKHVDGETVTLSPGAGVYYARVYGYQMANQNPDYCIRVDQ